MRRLTAAAVLLALGLGAEGLWLDAGLEAGLVAAAVLRGTKEEAWRAVAVTAPPPGGVIKKGAGARVVDWTKGDGAGMRGGRGGGGGRGTEGAPSILHHQMHMSGPARWVLNRSKRLLPIHS